MSKRRWHIVTSIVAGALVALPPPAESAQRHKWWASDEVKEEVGLTDEQSAELESVFQAIRPRLWKLVHQLEAEEEALTAIMHAMQAEEWEVTLQIDKVESARSALSKTRTLMLYRMHKKLTPEQLDRLHAMWERRHKDDQTASRDPR